MGVMSVPEITEALGLHNMRREWYIQGTCALTGDGLYDGLDWLSKTVSKKKWLLKINLYLVKFINQTKLINFIIYLVYTTYLQLGHSLFIIVLFTIQSQQNKWPHGVIEEFILYSKHKLHWSFYWTS